MNFYIVVLLYFTLVFPTNGEKPSEQDHRRVVVVDMTVEDACRRTGTPGSWLVRAESVWQVTLSSGGYHAVEVRCISDGPYRVEPIGAD